MVFYVFFEPRVIADAADAGSHGLDLLINILKGFQHNCLILDFLDRYATLGVGIEVKQLEEKVLREGYSPDRVKRLKTVLVHLQKTRFVYEIVPDWSDPDCHMAIVVDQCATLGLDVMVLAQDQEIEADVETTSLATYTVSEFEDRRASAASGKAYPPGAWPEMDFMKQAFGRVFRLARQIDVYDAMISRYWGSNYQHTLRQFVVWLKTQLVRPKDCILVLHTEQNGLVGQAIEAHLRSCRSGAGINDLCIKVQYYDPQTMPHDRFIVAGGIALAIGRGMDFLDYNDHVNRDVTIAILDEGSTSALFNAHNASKQGNLVAI